MNNPRPTATTTSRNGLSNSRRLTLLLLVVGLTTAALFAVTSSARRADNKLSERSPAITSRAQAKLMTDKDAYSPNDTIIFTGTNWTPGEAVEVVIDSDGNSNPITTINAVADASGSFTVPSIMPEQSGAAVAETSEPKSFTSAAKKKTRRSSAAKSTSKTRRSTAAKVTVGSRAKKNGKFDESYRAKAKGTSGTLAGTQIGRVKDKRISTFVNAEGQTVYSIAAANFDISPPLTELANSFTEQEKEFEGEENELPSWRVLNSGQKDPVTQVAPSPGKSLRSMILAAPSTGFNFPGVPGSGSFPPDNNGSVGNDQYVETVNSRYQVWSLNRTTNIATSVLGPSNINTLWAGFGGACQTQNAGDPIVLYDKFANRWLISQFTSTVSGGNYFQCVAVSTTANAAGTYARYAFTVPNNAFGDYPHFGVWTDAYYMMAHAFTSASGGTYVAGVFAAMNRTKMLAGDPTATWQVIMDPLEGGHMPADLDGFTPPPADAPGIFTSIGPNGMSLYRMKVDFATPANTVRTLQAIMPTAPATSACGGATCLPQPGSTLTLDSLADRLMFRLAYRNFVDHESLVVTHSVDPGVTGVVSGVRWYDFRISGSPNATCPTYPCTYQQGTIADVANGRSRWMPSIAMDGAENILVGYSTTGKTNGTENHTIRYTGRAKDDPLGTMTAPEVTTATGNRNTTGTGTRWGDYTSMTIDPFDDCTFWYVNQFYSTVQTGNGNWRTQIASARFPAGSGPGQCQATTCTTRPTSAAVIGTATVIGDNQIQITWTGITPEPGSYAIERAIGPAGSEGLYQPLAAVAGNVTSYIDTAVQGGLTYSYRVVAATDAAGKCQSLVHSSSVSTTATGSCNLKPTFAGATSASSTDDPSCGVTINWTPATSSCPLTPTMSYSVFRGTVPDFVPSAANRIATCVPGPGSYVDSNALTSGVTYYYVVRAEDNSFGNGGECGGNEEFNSVVVAGTAYGAGLQAAPGTWTDAGGDVTAFLQLNPGGGGNTLDQVWRFIKTANDAGANHTPGGAYAYRTAGPTAAATYSSSECSVAQTPGLIAGATSVNLTYWERHQLEKGWDGVAVEYQVNGGAWNTVPTPSNATGAGCLGTDVITDWATLGCTGTPPGNACAYPATGKNVITGPVGTGTSCTNWTTGALTAYGRRCHPITGLNSGDTVKFRWRMASDSGAEFAGFYLDDIAVTNILLPNSCSTFTAAPTSLITNPASGAYGGTVNLSATLTDGTNPLSGKSIDFTLNGMSKGSAVTDGSGVATLLNVSLSGINVGVYPSGVRGSFAGGGGFGASSNTAQLTVSKADQTITVNTSAPASAAYNSQFTVAAAASSGLPVTYSSSGSCTNAGATFTITSSSGVCTVQYDQAGNSNYNAAPQVTQSVNAVKANQTITVNTHAPTSAAYNSQFTVAATASSGLPVTYGSSGSCTNVGATYTMTSGSGTCTVLYDQAGNGNFNAAPQVTESVNALKLNQAITVNTHAPASAVHGSQFTVAATSDSGLAVAYGSSGSCTNVGATFTMVLGSGTCTVSYNQAGDSNYNPAATVTELVAAQECGAPTNIARASYGATAVASSTVNANFPAAGAIDGERNGNSWGSGGGWNDGTRSSYPDNVQVNLNVLQTFGEIDVYTLKNDFNSGSVVNDTTTFSSYGITNFNVQYWTGSVWADVPGGAVTGNNLVKRKFVFPDITTDRVRVLVNDSADHLYSRVVEVEAYSCNPAVVPTPSPSPTPTPTPTPCDSPANNVALASAGASAVASSTVNANFPAAGAIDGEHNGNTWGSSGGWNDATRGVFPDNLQVNFSGMKTLREIDVYTLKNDFNSGSVVSDITTFTSYGITSFNVQYWNGSAWVDVPGGVVVGNNLVKRKFVFPDLTTDKIRIVVNDSADHLYSRIVEIEAFACSP